MPAAWLGRRYRFSRPPRQFAPVAGSRLEAVLATWARPAQASQAAVHAAACRSPPARRAVCWRLARRHTELVRRVTPRSQLEQVLLDYGVNDPVSLERPLRLIALPARLWPTSGVVSSDPGRRLVLAGTLLPAGWRDAGPGWGGTAGGRRGPGSAARVPGPGHDIGQNRRPGVSAGRSLRPCR